MPKNWVALFGTALGLVSARGESEGGFPVPDEHPSELRVVAGERHGDDAGRSVRGRRAAVPVPAAPQAHPLQLGPQHQHGRQRARHPAIPRSAQLPQGQGARLSVQLRFLQLRIHDLCVLYLQILHKTVHFEIGASLTVCSHSLTICVSHSRMNGHIPTEGNNGVNQANHLTVNILIFLLFTEAVSCNKVT